MTFWTMDSLKRASGGTWLSRGKDPEGAASLVLQGLTTDSRSVRKGQAFLALRGERFDGHAFAVDAARAGCPLLIVDQQGAEPVLSGVGTIPDLDAAVLRVADTGKALLRLAAAYRKTLERTKVIAVVGSNGKTTTTRLIAAALDTSLRGTASVKSFNNAVGVPLTILSALPTDQYLLCEVGTNAPGEIAQLAAVVQPDIVVITSIGREHLEGFGSLEGVAREEAAILSCLAPGGLAIVPAELPLGCEPLTDALRIVPNVLRFGTTEAADLRASDIHHRRGQLRFTINGRLDATLNLIGRHNAHNALAALAVGRRLGLDERRIIESLASAKGPEMRLERVEVEVAPGSEPHITFINDAYNANPDSMLASLATFEELVTDWPGLARRIVVLGDMLELGDSTESSHREVARRVVAMPMLDVVALVGPHSAAGADTARRAGWPDSKLVYLPEASHEAMQRIALMLRPGDGVLLKGSRRLKLERVIESLRNRVAPDQPAATSVPPPVTLTPRPQVRKHG